VVTLRRLVTPQRLFDVVLAAGIATVGVAELWVPFVSMEGQGSRELSTAVVLVLCVALAFRRVRPLPSALVVLTTWVAVYAVTPVHVLFWGQFVPMVVAVFSVARHGSGRRGIYGGVAGGAVLLFFNLFVVELQGTEQQIFHWTVFVVAWSFGRGLRAMEARAHDSARRAIEVEHASKEQTTAAIADERARIARELHDVVAHAVSVMVVQAGAAEQVVDDDPEYVRSALGTIRGTGASALAEMRRVVVMLRDAGADADGPGDLTPQPGMAEVATLVDDLRAQGVDATLVVDGAVRVLPAGLDLAVYRIVQEALTNVRRHAAAAPVRVRLTYGDGQVTVEVVDDGPGTTTGSSSVPTGGGHGLIGMRERAALYGGTLEAGARAAGGFTVRAVLPVAST
jgi:signal transduction histidine kinase